MKKVAPKMLSCIKKPFCLRKSFMERSFAILGAPFSLVTYRPMNVIATSDALEH